MSGLRCCRVAQLTLLAILASWTGAGWAEKAPFGYEYGGYLISTDFTVDSGRQTVISLPPLAQPGDQLSIRPLRLNNDEYLILQKCSLPDCADAEVVRAWNALGPMGPAIVTSKNVSIEAGVRYMVWMQRISTQGGNSFSLYQRNSPPLIFNPEGSPKLFLASDLAGAHAHGPTRVEQSSKEGGTFMAKFEGGSVVRLQLLRSKRNAEPPMIVN